MASLRKGPRKAAGIPAPTPWAPEFEEAHWRAAPFFAEGARLDHEGRYDEAFAAFLEGSKIKRAVVDPDSYAEFHTKLVENYKWLFSTALFETWRDGYFTPAPIFILGLPRSGSTLLEQVLATHSKVQGLGELSRVGLIVQGEYPFVGGAPKPGHFRTLASTYLEHMHGFGWKSASRFVDKALVNYLYIGMIHLMFPRATIIHTLREPADTCLSCFRHNFQQGNETRMTYGLADIGRHYVRYRDLMDHWARVLPGRVINVDHEGFVGDFPNQTRHLVEACGLEWEERCLRYYENPRTVITSSSEQVRQPIFTGSIGRWRHYRKHLAPLFEALGAYAPADA